MSALVDAINEDLHSRRIRFHDERAHLRRGRRTRSDELGRSRCGDGHQKDCSRTQHHSLRDADLLRGRMLRRRHHREGVVGIEERPFTGRCEIGDRNQIGNVRRCR